MFKRSITCKYCGTQFEVKARDAETLSLYVRCCKACWDNDEPGMARFERAAAMMGTAWAIEHA